MIILTYILYVDCRVIHVSISLTIHFLWVTFVGIIFISNFIYIKLFILMLFLFRKLNNYGLDRTWLLSSNRRILWINHTEKRFISCLPMRSPIKFCRKYEFWWEKLCVVESLTVVWDKNQLMLYCSRNISESIYCIQFDQC